MLSFIASLENAKLSNTEMSLMTGIGQWWEFLLIYCEWKCK